MTSCEAQRDGEMRLPGPWPAEDETIRKRSVWYDYGIDHQETHGRTPLFADWAEPGGGSATARVESSESVMDSLVAQDI